MRGQLTSAQNDISLYKLICKNTALDVLNVGDSAGCDMDIENAPGVTDLARKKCVGLPPTSANKIKKQILAAATVFISRIYNG